MSEQRAGAKSIFYQILEDQPADRGVFLDKACGSDTDLRREIDELLRYHDEAGTFLDTPVDMGLGAAKGPNVAPAPADDLDISENLQTWALSNESYKGELAFPTVPGHEIVRELGRGGMGVVYLARQVRADRLVALKVILTQSHAGEKERQRFRTEAEAIARLQHPGIVQIFEVGEHESIPYFSLEYCSAGSLAQYLSGTPIDAREAAELARDLTLAINAAHAAMVIHRDLKPANVLLTPHSQAVESVSVSSENGQARLSLRAFTAKLTDFGLSKKLDESDQTRTGIVMGTPSYIAPEQAQADKGVGFAADIYSLGAILYECLTGRPPFKAATSVDTIMLVTRADPAPPRQLQPGVPRDLETICLKCLQKDPNRRYRSAGELAEDLQHYLDGKPINARPVSPIERSWRWSRRHPALVGLLAALILLFVGVAGMAFYYQREQSARSERQARTVAKRQASLKLARARRARLHERCKAPGGVFRLLDNTDIWKRQIESAKAELKRAMDFHREIEGIASADFKKMADTLGAELQQDFDIMKLAIDLDRIRLEKSTIVSGVDNFESAAQRYPLTFQAAGMNVKNGSSAKIASSIRKSAIRELLLVSLADWAFVSFRRGERELHERLLSVLRQANDDPHWRELATPTVWHNGYKLRGIAQRLAANKAAFAKLSPWLYVLVGELLYVNAERRAAAKWLRQAQMHHPADFWINFALGNSLLAHKPADAIGYYRVALSRRSDSSEVHSNLGGALYSHNDLPDALATCKRAVQLNQRNFGAHHNMGIVLFKQKEFKRAVAAYRKAIALNNKSTQTYVNLGAALAELKDINGAADAFAKAIKLDPKLPGGHLQLGLVEVERKNWASAAKHFRATVQLDRTIGGAYFGLGLALANANSPEQAIAAYRKCIVLNPTNFEPHQNLGVLLYKKKDLKRAKRHFLKAIELNSKSAVAHHGAGAVLREENDLARAAQHFRNALKADPKYKIAWDDLAIVLHRSKKLVEAVVAYEKSISLAESHPNSHINLGLAFKELGRFSEAVVSINKGMKLLATGHPLYQAALRLRGECQRLIALEKKVPLALRGEKLNVLEKLAMADMCQRYLRRYRVAAQLYEQSFAEGAALAEDLKIGHRYNAACAAVLAAREKGNATSRLSDKERTAILNQAHKWLSDDLKAQQKAAESGPVATIAVEKRLRHWKTDPDLASVRDVQQLANLATMLQMKWWKLWTDVAAAHRELKSRYIEEQLTGHLLGKAGAHSLKFRADKTYLIELHSRHFDTLLELQNAAGETLAKHDDINYPFNLNSRLLFTPKESAEFRLIASALGQRGNGAYRIFVWEFAGTPKD